MSADLATVGPDTAQPAGAAVRPSQAGRIPGLLVWALPAALAAALTLHGLTARSLGFDEGATVAIASQHGSALWSAIAHDGGNMAGYYLLIHILLGWFGDSLVVLRLPGAIAAVAAVALTAGIGRRLFGDLAALAGGVLAAVSLPLVYWGQTARGYAPMVAFVCAAYLALIALSDESRAGRRLPAVAYGAAITLAMYCSLVAVLAVAAQLPLLIDRRRLAREVARALAAVAVCCLPLVALAIGRGSGQLFWVPRPSRTVDGQVLQSLTSAGLSPSFHAGAVTQVLLSLTLVALVALVVQVILDHRHGRPVWARALVLAWCLVPAALTFAYSLIGQPVFVARNLMVSTPAVAVALTAWIPSAARRPRVVAVRPLTTAVALAAALAVVLGLRAIPLAGAYGVSPEPWRAVTAEVVSRSRPGDCIAFYPQDARMAFDYYVRATAGGAARAPRPILPQAAWGTARPYVEDYAVPAAGELARRTAGCRRLWLVSSHEGQPDGPAQARANRARWLALTGELEAMFGSGRIERHGYASTIHVRLLPGAR